MPTDTVKMVPGSGATWWSVFIDGKRDRFALQLAALTVACLKHSKVK
jgi:hypothetical protein